MLVAFSTESQTRIDAHFGLAPAFALYDVTPEAITAKGFVYCPQEFASDADKEDKVESRMHILRGCAVVYCTSIGGPAAARLVQSGIHPLKVPEGTPIEGELNRLQTLLAGSPPPWLRKRLQQEKMTKEDE
ncbi:nitrogen fixation protein NifX [Heliobacterium gestii]|uniref:Nitrogen fixation protein NifX n=1 Tax=Heliomicrobium gestii TaxID=2699 RepID=A0A845LJL7_HELGE|nr:nitrogen fixation protein NifX [Heliomicrobium gestii]MBM7868426.1 nitrogen fixation protein NifX [Heliomicrobium gestii]MZP44585.1 nitrogen fixation protein NifX [Heliomicrobium gestii]